MGFIHFCICAIQLPDCEVESSGVKGCAILCVRMPKMQHLGKAQHTWTFSLPAVACMQQTCMYTYVCMCVLLVMGVSSGNVCHVCRIYVCMHMH